MSLKKENKKSIINTFVLPNMTNKKNKIKPYHDDSQYERDREYERNERRMKHFKDNHNGLFCVLFLCFPIMYLCTKCSKNQDVNNLDE